MNGTFANQDDNWQAASPLLANHGYCVFSFNYGGTSPTALVQGTGGIAASAGQLASFVTRVLAATGAAKVDLVGHSQGGMDAALLPEVPRRRQVREPGASPRPPPPPAARPAAERVVAQHRGLHGRMLVAEQRPGRVYAGLLRRSP